MQLFFDSVQWSVSPFDFPILSFHLFYFIHLFIHLFIVYVISWILEGVHAKNQEATILFVDFTKAFDSIHRGKMEQLLLTYGPLKETITAIMMLYWNTKVKVCSPDGDTDYFDIIAGVLQGEILAPYLFIIWEASWQVQLSRKQCLINRERYRHPTIKSMDSYLWFGFLFNGISALFRLFNAKAILLEEQ